MTVDLEQHNREIQQNLAYWQRKPVLHRIYARFHALIAAQLSGLDGHIVELGSGIGNIKETIPGCLRTDLFANPWIDQVENAFALSFAEGSVADLILFDVFHHLRYPGRAFAEFKRVLKPGGRVIVFDPCVSLLGRVVFGLLHHEPLALREPIVWEAPADWSPAATDYYAAQGNAWRLFVRGELAGRLDSGWERIACQRYSAISYVASGGYSKPQMYPTCAYGAMRALDWLCDLFPGIFATRLLVVLQKRA